MTSNLIARPRARLLRVFPFDPSVGGSVDSDGLSEITIAIPWEDDLKSGPVGEYIEVIDTDPASQAHYRPVNLNSEYVLAQNGLPPTESNPQFHQQMVYAVAMATIGHFERALSRPAFWSDRRIRDADGNVKTTQFVQRLRIYPHGLRDRNAYYSPEKKALLFGYFRAAAPDLPRGMMIFTCLSHDIIAHEMTHALLDGVHPRFNEPMNADVLAFHEGFADLVAIFQRFSYPGVLRDQITRTRGNLGNENMLAQLAQQFGRATGRSSALRDALGSVGSDGKWQPRAPNQRALVGVTEPHDRGAVLVAAVFGAFMKVYRMRTADLYRLASDGTGILEDGDIHPDLTGRLAEEAADCARTILRMCIRAIDYCPPVGITFGDYLRGVITADSDEAPIEGRPYRLAFNESFREWGIHARQRQGVTVDTLLWPTLQEVLEEPQNSEAAPEEKAPLTVRSSLVNKKRIESMKNRQARASQEARVVKRMFGELKNESSLSERANFPPEKETTEAKTDIGAMVLPSLTTAARKEIWDTSELAAKWLHDWLHGEEQRKLASSLGIVITPGDGKKTIFQGRVEGTASVEIHSVRFATRLGEKGWAVPDLVVEITQRRRGYFDTDEQRKRDQDGNFTGKVRGDFIFRSGVTLLMNPATKDIRRVIRSSGRIDDDIALGRMRQYLTSGAEPPNAFASPHHIASSNEPFALLHRDHGER